MRKLGLDLAAKIVRRVHHAQELAHELLLLILEELVPAARDDEAALQPQQLHPVRIDAQAHGDFLSHVEKVEAMLPPSR